MRLGMLFDLNPLIWYFLQVLVMDSMRDASRDAIRDAIRFESFNFVFLFTRSDRIPRGFDKGCDEGCDEGCDPIFRIPYCIP